MRLSRGESIPQAGQDVVDALALMGTGRAPSETLAGIRSAVERGDIDPRKATEQIVRHDRDEAHVRSWLAGLAEAVQDKPLHEWTAAHERAMAAFRAMNGMPEWTEFDGYRVEAAAPDVFAAGRELYHDEVRGCVRCHGPRGTGIEGYPPLDRSPWVLGAPARAAAIVVHGLYGSLEMPDGRSFNSAMEPIGGILDDQSIAAALTYVRQSWGNFAAPVSAQDVAAARAAGPQAGGMWEVKALDLKHPLYRDTLVSTQVAVSGGFPRALRSVGIFLGVPLVIAVLLIVILERRSKPA